LSKDSDFAVYISHQSYTLTLALPDDLFDQFKYENEKWNVSADIVCHGHNNKG
jgi:hypothetical protein